MPSGQGLSPTILFWLQWDILTIVKPATICVIITLTLTNKWELQQIDVNNTFLNGSLQEDIYMSQPHIFENQDPSFVCKLHKALYALK